MKSHGDVLVATFCWNWSEKCNKCLYILQQWPGRSDFGLWIEYFLGIKRMCLVFPSVHFIDVLQVWNTFFFLNHNNKWMKRLWNSVVLQWLWYWRSCSEYIFWCWGSIFTFPSGHFVDVIYSPLFLLYLFFAQGSLLIGALEYLISTTPKFRGGKGGFVFRDF